MDKHLAIPDQKVAEAAIKAVGYDGDSVPKEIEKDSLAREALWKKVLQKDTYEQYMMRFNGTNYCQWYGRSIRTTVFNPFGPVFEIVTPDRPGVEQAVGDGS